MDIPHAKYNYFIQAFIYFDEAIFTGFRSCRTQ